ncbi:MAG: Gfo/Idh/MocA family oxidoreductase [Victivallaceae bacterium]|nr:Gfo/Idh/MocA family oxidoreductase [Victivallaceae bacterium]MDD5664167.1 Gfo/Idh/MocA family oxidoreductase [Victivallaceae bacterium]
MKKTKIGLIGCGMISSAYFNAAKTFQMIEVVACADSNSAAAEERGKEFKVPAMSIEALLAQPEIEIVLNLTPPKAHSAVDKKILQSGKNVYSEKPFGVDLADAKGVMELAATRKLQVGCAPDTFLGGGQQTARKIIDDGWIGKPLAGTAFVLGRGPEKWPHAPFFYDYGGGPMLDLGPYYITALINLLGPARSVTAVAFKSSDFRKGGTETVPPVYPVNVSTTLSGQVEFACGAVITVITSFDVYKHGHSHPIEIYGNAGSLAVPDPNTFGGPVKIFRKGYSDWENVPLSHRYTENFRSIGVADMASALQSGRSYRASGELAFHVLEVMLAFDESSRSGGKVDLQSTCQRPAALPLGLEEGELD